MSFCACVRIICPNTRRAGEHLQVIHALGSGNRQRLDSPDGGPVAHPDKELEDAGLIVGRRQ